MILPIVYFLLSFCMLQLGYVNDVSKNIKIYDENGEISKEWHHGLKKLEIKYDLLFKDLKDKMITKLYSILSGKTCQGVFNDLGEEVIPKGKKYSQKILNEVDDYIHLTENILINMVKILKNGVISFTTKNPFEYP